MKELDILQQALKNTEGKIPEEVFDAFFPKEAKVAGQPLVEITLGHTMLLSQLGHPLSRGELDNWNSEDIAIALFVFTRTAKALRDLIKNDTFEDALIDFVQQIPAEEVRKSAFLLISHYLTASKTGVEMEEVKNKISQKKTIIHLVLRFFSFLPFLKSIISGLKKLFSRSR